MTGGGVTMATSSTGSRRKLKNILFGVLAVALVALLSILLTVAYLRDKTDEKTHTFTLGESVDIVLKQDENPNITAEPNREYPDLKATVKIPSSAMSKEYIAVKVFFYEEEEKEDTGQKYLKYKPISYKTFKQQYGDLYSYDKPGLDAIGQVGNETTRAGCRSDWILDSTTENNTAGAMFYYKGVATGTAIEPVAHDSNSEKSVIVFDSVRLKQDFELKYSLAQNANASFPLGLPLYDENGNKLPDDRKIQNKDQLKGFKIVVCAYAVQGNIEIDAAKTALHDLAVNNP